jgi:hypothetical protein
MTTDFFDTLYPSAIEGVIDDPVVTDQDDTPNHVLELDQDWKMAIKWQLTSSKPSSYPVDIIDGTWHIQLSVESLGKGLEDVVAKTDVPVSSFINNQPDLRDWSHEFNIAADKIQDEAVYKLATLITFTDNNGARRAMAGFVEGPVITFYQDQP